MSNYNIELFGKAEKKFIDADSLNSFREAIDTATEAMNGNADRAIDKLLASYRKKYKSNPIIYLAENDMLNKKIINYFKAYINLDDCETLSSTYDGHSALYFLLKRKRFLLADYLLDQGANLVGLDMFKQLLEYNSGRNDEQLEWIIEKIIQKYGEFDSYQRKHHQYNLLGDCFAHNLHKSAAYLLKKGANPFYVYNGKKVIDALPADMWAPFRSLKEEDFIKSQKVDDNETLIE